MARSIKHRRPGDLTGRQQLQNQIEAWRIQGQHPPRTWNKLKLTTLLLPGGLKGCCWCGSLLTGRKISWCSSECVEDYQVRTGQGQVIRRLVQKRDRQICRLCGVDVGSIEQNMRGFIQDLRDGKWFSLETLAAWMGTVRPWLPVQQGQIIELSLALLEDLWEVLGPHPHNPQHLLASAWHRMLGFQVGPHWPVAFWEADHIVPVELGGGVGSGLENFQTACRPCHVFKTNLQAKARKISKAGC